MSVENEITYFKDPQLKAVPLVKGKPTPEDKFVYIGRCHRTKRDITLCYQTFGNPQNPCILLICGLGSTCYTYPIVFCQQLVSIGFYVVRFDNRDYGLSTHLNGLPTISGPRVILPAWMSIGEAKLPYRIEEMALDALNLLTAIGISKAHVMGSSMGGMIAQRVAIYQPERILSLTILFSHCGGPNVKPPSPAQGLFAVFGKPKSESIEDIVNFKIKLLRLNAGNLSFDEKECIEMIRTTNNRMLDYREGANRQLWAIRRSERRDIALQELRGVPTLIIHGLKDTLVPYENGIHLGELIKDSKVLLIPEMGHSLPNEVIPTIVEELELLKRKTEMTL
ncbi:unnamed protein product [Phytomonas sp. Hart1]|nr:unnamed protein product [Phytomonas sp. Hart1]|eukprot:CCW66818.1 unnamed protein product [Phytomonas sp. isolate Hart1]